MNPNDFVDIDATRALQASKSVRESNLATMTGWGAYCMIKITRRGEPQTSVMNYVTHMESVSGRTPVQMEDVLGLQKHQLASGADIYRLSRLPTLDEFLPRGYTTLVDGLRLRPGLRQDSSGYRPGHGAFQIQLIKPIPANRIASLGPHEPFEPGIHPSLRHLYPNRR